MIGKEQIHDPAGTYDTYYVIYHITKGDETETYEVWITQDIPQMMVREKFFWELVSELVKINN